MPRTTLQDIADALNMGKSSVSYALRGDSRIPEETQKKVRAMAEQLGYKKNPLISAWMQDMRNSRVGETKSCIACVTTLHDPESYMSFRGNRELYESISEHAAKSGYSTELFWLHKEGLSADRLKQILNARGIYGIIFLNSPNDSGELTFNFSNFACATYSYRIRKPDLHRVVSNHHQLIDYAVRGLLERGSKKVGMILNSWDDEYSHQIRTGWFAARENFGSRKVAPILRSKGDESVEADVRQWVEKNKVEGVLVTSPGLLEIIRRLNRPSLSPVTFNFDPELNCSGMDQNNEALGAALVDLIIGQLHRNDRGIPQTPKTVLIKGHWRDPGCPAATEPST